VISGDLLVTSGLGGGFPAGYPVGTVAEVKRDPAQSLADVDVKPAAALDRSRELMFVWLKPQESSPVPAAPATSAAPAASAGHVAPMPAPSQPQAQSAAAVPAKTPPPAKHPLPAKNPPPVKTPPPAGANDE
jgi:rod shape-determining protein MreC